MGWFTPQIHEEVYTKTMQLRSGSVASAGGSSPLAGIMPPARSQLTVVNPESVMSLGIVERCVDILTNAVGQLEIKAFKGGKQVNTPRLLDRPNRSISKTAFLQETTYSLALYGNAYWRIIDKDLPSITQLQVLNPESVTKGDHRGVSGYWVGQEFIPDDYIRHLRLGKKPGDPMGYGPVQKCQAEFNAALMLRRFQEETFGNVPVGVLSTDQKLNAEESAKYAQAMINFLNNRGGILVAGNGLEFKPIKASPKDLQYLDVQRIVNLGIATMFGVPPLLLNVELAGTSTTYLNAQELKIHFYDTLVGYINEIEDHLSDMLPHGQRAKFDVEDLLRMDSLKKAEVQRIQIECGLRTANELRAEEGLPPLPTPVEPIVKEVPNEPRTAPSDSINNN